MQRLAIVDSAGPEGASTRRRLAGEIGSVLREATADPARMRPLWTAFSRGEPVRPTDLRRAISECVVTEAVRHDLLLAVDAGDDEPWLRGSVCIIAVDVAGELLWVASDFPWDDHDAAAVTGPGEASATLLAAVPDADYSRVLDMGCGSGAIGVRLAVPGRTLLSSDVNPRALALTELTAALNGRSVHTVRSDFADRIDGQFDLVLCNPPFILRRPCGRTIFRDSEDGSGHALLAHQLAPLLSGGGLALYLTNWEYSIGEPNPLGRLAADLAMTDRCGVLVLERAIVPVEKYVQVWSDDADEQLGWVAAFRHRDVTHVGTGLVAVHRGGAGAHPTTVLRDYDTPRDLLGRLVGDWVVTATSQR